MGTMDGWVDLNNITRPQQYHSIVQGGMAFRHELRAACSRRGSLEYDGLQSALRVRYSDYKLC